MWKAQWKTSPKEFAGLSPFSHHQTCPETQGSTPALRRSLQTCDNYAPSDGFMTFMACGTCCFVIVRPRNSMCGLPFRLIPLAKMIGKESPQWHHSFSAHMARKPASSIIMYGNRAHNNARRSGRPVVKQLKTLQACLKMLHSSQPRHAPGEARRF